jgi:hypothetical protein
MTATNIPANNSFSFDDVKEMFKENGRQLQEVREMFKETDRQFKETEREMKEMFQETKEMFRETDKKFNETDKKFNATDKKFKETDKKISQLGDRIGEIIESMVEGGIVEKFNQLNHSFHFNRCGRHVKFYYDQLSIAGEIDLLLENNEVALLIEVKTNLTVSDVQDHLERIKKYCRCLEAEGKQYKLFGAVAGGVIHEDIKNYVLKHGLFLITQSGNSFKIIQPPEETKLKIR